MSPDWRLVRRIEALLAGDDGQADEDIAARLGAAVADVRTALRVMYRRHQVDICWGYACLVPRAEGRRAA